MIKDNPNHIAIIMDGNRRWARKNKLSEIWGHRQGTEALIEIVEEAVNLKVGFITVHTLSSENFRNRSKTEIQDLFKLIGEGFSKHLPRLKKHGVRLEFIGNLKELPKSTQVLVSKAKRDLSGGKRCLLTIALNYGGRQEIVRVADRLREKGALITEWKFSRELFTAGSPDPDILIRTGGAKRLSNFLLWQLSYTELYFTDTLWPDFDRKELRKAVKFLQTSKRNFGA